MFRQSSTCASLKMNCSFSFISLLVRMDHIQKRTLDCPDYSIRAMGVVLLYLDIDDVHVH